MTRKTTGFHPMVAEVQGREQRQMFRFGVKNMRRLRDVPPIELKPITLLVGKNSSGKSTFLRTFPLIRQSLNTRTSSPILWYGELVDFGQFSSVVSGGNENDRIVLSFGLDHFHVGGRFTPDASFRNRQLVHIPVDVELSISGIGGRTSLDAFSVNFPKRGVRFEVEVGSDGELHRIIQNGRDVSSLLESVIVRFSLGSLFPDVIFRAKSELNDRYSWYSDDWWAVQHVVKTISGKIHKRIGSGKIEAFALSFLEMERFDNDSLVHLENDVTNGSFRKLVLDLRSKNSLGLRDSLQELFELYSFTELISPIFSELRGMLAKTLYIGPMRARSERYYRYQDLAVSEIDPDGKNFPMFLNSLNDLQRIDFSEWVKRLFGYGVRVQSESGHISINLEYGTDTSNIVDNGYGISQVLPVLGQIWWASRGLRTRYNPPIRSTGATIVIEQPELHLHPAHQALLADAIVGERNAETPYDDRIKFIVETHSEALVNRLGQLVSEGVVPHQDVQVLVFEDDKEHAVTTVRISPFDEEGVLQNWPFGFFQPAV